MGKEEGGGRNLKLRRDRGICGGDGRLSTDRGQDTIEKANVATPRKWCTSKG